MLPGKPSDGPTKLDKIKNLRVEVRFENVSQGTGLAPLGGGSLRPNLVGQSFESQRPSLLQRGSCFATASPGQVPGIETRAGTVLNHPRSNATVRRCPLAGRRRRLSWCRGRLQNYSRAESHLESGDAVSAASFRYKLSRTPVRVTADSEVCLGPPPDVSIRIVRQPVKGGYPRSGRQLQTATGPVYRNRARTVAFPCPSHLVQLQGRIASVDSG